PNKRAGRDLAKRWRAIFEETRKAFLEDTSKIGISHRAVRLRALQRIAEKAEGQDEQPSVAEPPPLIGQIPQPPAQGRVRRRLRLVAHPLAIRSRNLARPPFR